MVFSDANRLSEINASYILVFLSLIFFLFLIIMLFTRSSIEKSHHERIKHKSKTIEVFILDITNDLVKYFKSFDLRAKKTMTMMEFYSKFSLLDRERIISWVGRLLDDDETAKSYIEVIDKSKRGKHRRATFLQVQKIDLEKKIIFLESHKLNYVLNKTNKGVGAFVSKETVINAFHESNASGMSFCFNFFNKISKTNEIEHLSYLEIKSIFTNFINEDTFITIDENKFFVFAFKIYDRVQSLDFIEKVKNRINSYLLIESLTDEIDFSVGCAENAYFYRDVKLLFKSLYSLADFAKDDNQFIIYFDENSNTVSEDSTFKTEVENILENHKIKYTYQPVVDLSARNAIGYTSFFKPVGSIFKDIEELKKFAVRTDDDFKLFSTVTNNALANFTEEKYFPYLKLFLHLSVNEMQFVTRSLVNAPGIKETRLVLCFEEKDIANLIDEEEQLENVISYLKNFKSIGFEIALRLDDNILNMSTHFYNLFDYYILSAKDYMGDNLTEQLPVFKGLIEQLLKYHKTMVVVDISTWNVVQLVYKFGINIISGDAIASANENILPLDKKAFTKLKKLEE